MKALAAEEALRRLMLRRFQALADRVFRTEFLVLAYQGSLQLVAFASFGLFLVVGSIEVVHGNLSLGEFVAFNALVALATGPMLTLLSLWDQGQLARVLFDRLDDVLAPEPEQGADRDRLRTVSTLEGRVELHGVGFRYGGPEAPAILEDVTLTVEPGETVALVGRSGSGKTTLIKLLAGLLEPTEGEILFDGFELRTLDYRTLRRKIGFVLQESYLFDDTIAANIAFGEDGSRPGQGRLGREGRERPRVRRAAAARLRDARRRVRACGSPAASSSGSRSRARSTTARRSCSSTRPRARSTPSRSAPSRRASTSCSSAAPRS